MSTWAYTLPRIPGTGSQGLALLAMLLSLLERPQTVFAPFLSLKSLQNLQIMKENLFPPKGPVHPVCFPYRKGIVGPIPQCGQGAARKDERGPRRGYPGQAAFQREATAEQQPQTDPASESNNHRPNKRSTPANPTLTSRTVHCSTTIAS